MTKEETTSAIQKLSPAEKYHLIKNHVKPSKTFVFPYTSITGKHRAFQLHWLSICPWLVYSIHLDAAFCLPCVLFDRFAYNHGQLVCAPFTNWKKFGEKASEHGNSDYHNDSRHQMELFLNAKEKPNATVTSQQDCVRRKNIEENRIIVKLIIQALEYCGKQGIALRGKDETQTDETKNPGNFLRLVKMLGKHNEVLKKHLESPKLKKRNVHFVNYAK